VEAHDFYISPINYRLYHEGPAFTDEMDSLLHKRLAFKAEYELRLLRYDHAHYGALVLRRMHRCLNYVSTYGWIGCCAM
jgi:hypothetical protein